MTRSFTLAQRLSAVLLLTAGAYGTSDTCCNQLTKAFSGEKLFRPSNPNYQIENQKYWSATAVLSPGCIFVPESSADVSTAVKIFTKNKCWAGTNSGVLVSLSKFTEVTVSDDKESVVIGAGNRWGDVYAKTGEHNVTVTGGRISKVGVSGFLLGGGLSFLMHAEGFAANNVLSYEIVLANGKIATVTKDSSEDLFKALKGGTGNFGIVTSFKLQTFPVNDIYAGYLYYAPDQHNSLFPIMANYARQGIESDPKSHMISVFICAPSQNVDIGTFYTAYSEPVTSPPQVLKPFFDVSTTQSTVQVKTVKEATDELAEGFEDGLRYDMHGYSIRANAGLFKQIYDLWHSSTIGLNSTIPGWNSAIIYQPISNSMLRASERKGGNLFGLKPANDPLMVVSYQFTWQRPGDDDKAYAAIEKLIAESTSIAKSQGRLERYIYLNYAGSDQKAIESYGSAQVDFLRKVKAKYDPNQYICIHATYFDVYNEPLDLSETSSRANLCAGREAEIRKFHRTRAVAPTTREDGQKARNARGHFVVLDSTHLRHSLQLIGAMVPGFTLLNQFSAIVQLATSFCGAPQVCCDQLATALTEEKVFKASHPHYKVENTKYWSSTAILSPACVFVPHSSSDVSSAIKVLASNNCEFAVRSGGHTTNPGWAGTDSGVLISLSKLTTVEVSEDKASVVIGAGNRWGDVYTKTDEHNVTVTGGRVSKVGVSGFILGGGLSFLMFSEGFAADNVLSYEIVLANGKVSTVTVDSNGDLFKALKGGGGNFGIVTSFKLQTHPIKSIYAGFLYYPPTQYDSLFSIMEDYARKGADSDPKTHLISYFICSPSRNIDVATFYTAYSEPVISPPPAIKPFFDVPNAQTDVKIKTMKEAAEESNEAAVDGLRYNMQAFSVQADAGLFKQLFDVWHLSAIGLNLTVPGWTSGIIYQPISNNMLRAGERKGGNVFGLKQTKDPLMIIRYQFTWERPEDDDEVYAAIDKLVADSTHIARSQGLLERYIYLNYAGSNQNPIESYGPEQVDFLRKVKAKYDPNGVFEMLSRGGFKIPS